MALYTYNGKLLANSGGLAIHEDCCCSECGAQDIDCSGIWDACSPVISNLYTVTISGATGGCSGANGIYTLCYGLSCSTGNYTDSCNWWHCWASTYGINMYWAPISGVWRVLFSYLGNGTWRGNGPSTLCSPVGSYTKYSGTCTGTITVVVS